MNRRLLAVLVVASPLFFWRLGHPGFSDTEGMFAEPAREMVVTGDWVTPRMNGEPFLTKPPLMYWLSAALFTLTGPTEHARLWPALAGLGTVAATGALGALLFGEGAGIGAALILATSVGFFVESRLLRADMVLVLAITLALSCYVRLRRGGGILTAVGFWASIGLGALDKGLLAIALPGGIIVAAEAVEGILRPRTLVARLRALHAPLGIAVLLVLAGPWHALAALHNPGFLWDYTVNQHVLFLFDKKLPRDSIPDSLGFFLAMFLVRGLPWSLLFPAAALWAYRTVRDDPVRAPAVGLIAAWVAVVLGFFALAPSRLEHYSLPALPATALLVGALLADARSRIAFGWLACPLAACAALAFAAMVPAPARLIAWIDPTLTGLGLDALVRPTGLLLACTLSGMALLLATHRTRLAMGIGVAGTAALLFVVQVAHERTEALFSWRPFAEMIHARAPQGARVFFRASDEYQLCGGLEYYLRQPLDLLAPPGWVPPTFLVGRTERLFTSSAELERLWRAGGTFWVSDDVAPPGAEGKLAPDPHTLVARAGSRVLVQAQ
ncbi:MAG TPA: glycosyltransferase family 39 protein [Candidatus Limnocylindria bacterium]|nr:glycosyltransferase family 39 protein [Candidatus Limnocylindria bacterium]